MKLNKIYTALFILAITLFSCSIDSINVRGNDVTTFSNLDYTGFTGLEVSGGFKVYVTFSETEESVQIEANENLHQFIETSLVNNSLVVKLKNNINIKGQPTLNIYITTKSINEFSAIADTNIYLENTLIADNVKINISSDSAFSGELFANTLNLKAMADANADLKGSINKLNADLTADAKLLSYNLNVKDLKLNMVADCDAFLTVTNTIDVDASADCLLRYKGDAVITYQHLTADSRIEKIN
ncbi:DUF2807 domain-containing protein [Flavobacteriaceae bacterium XHP0103]|uniref:head GIN domain-containing protein n=1 Tax=Marixanthotalea marina TaxID=2844359 RepID=UPI002989B416|nr:head GIN domain-containing protein [Marixanthotalea marina]MBU3822209.1 DUF2807 domain-containing protein [Marixanthotalea marina]